MPYGLGLVEFGGGSCALALPFLERAAEFPPVRAELFDALAQCYLVAGRFAEADTARAVAASLSGQSTGSD